MSAFRSNRERKPYNRPDSNETGAAAGGRWLHDKAPGGTEREQRRGGGGGREIGLGGGGVPNSRLTVSNLHYEITPEDLTSIFGQVGTLVKEPMIRYDRSGRSTGKATITYETAGEAAKAKKQFDGLLAKGEPMTIVFDTAIQKRSSSAPTTSLLNRIQKPGLAERITSTTDDIHTGGSGGGPVRSARGGGGGRRGGGGGGRQQQEREKKKPKTAEDLDKELDAFMVPAASTAATDVEMA